MNKKGDLLSTFYLIGFLFSLIVLIIVGSYVFSNIKNALLSNNLISSNANASQSIMKVGNFFNPLMNTLFLFLFFGTTLGLVISSFFIDTHPGFFIFFIIGLVIAVVFAGIISNIINEVGSVSELQYYYNSYPAMMTIVNNLPIIILAIGLITMIILFARRNTGGLTQF